MSCCSGCFKYFNKNCVSFACCVVFSFLVFGLSVATLAKVIEFEGSTNWACGMIGTVTSFWVNPPKLKADEQNAISNNPELFI